MSISLSKPLNYSINIAVKETIGITGEELYSNWIGSLKKHYVKQIPFPIGTEHIKNKLCLIASFFIATYF